MERLEKFYKDFKRPPFAPVYRPTVEEFADPIAYVAKIKPEAEKYGVVKIIPPENFKPPFVIDGQKFEFTPRVQKLNEIEALVRERVVFMEKLYGYWKLQGVEVRVPVVDNKYLDTFRLYSIVASLGGGDEVTKQKLWMSVAKKMGIRIQQGGSKLKEHYFKLIHPYITKIQQTSLKKEDASSGDEDDNDNKDVKYTTGSSMQGGKRRARKGRMMAGGGTHAKHLPKKKRVQDPMEAVFCAKCARGDDEDKLLLCEACDRSLHTFCCEPPLSTVPKDEWYCPDCSADQVFSMGTCFGFYDANTKYSLASFSEFANKFKQDYFKKDLQDITDDEVEKEFWKNILNLENTVAVKYGADLRVDKVGSGFPRRTDEFRGCDAKLKQHYANHAWNLNNLPVLKDSVLSHIDHDISGMVVPWVYVGMCFTTFCWHTEDHWTYSINYNHKGDRKVWYGINGADATKFEDAVRSISPGLFACQRDLLHHMTIAVNPQVLLSKGVRVWTVHQNAGEFVITFPRAYHAGYNEGFNVAEAVNFAPIDWLKMGRLAVSDYAIVRRTCVFSHEELVLKMVNACDRLSISMSVAAYEELNQIMDREVKRRKLVATLGVRETRREIFENLADEERECKHCHTTVFLSALSCPHDRLVCLDHAHRLCPKCPYSKCVLRYRYELPELTPFLLKLRDRTEAYTEWKEQVEYVLDENKRKPTLYAVDNLLETARSRRFPNGNALSRLHTIQRACQAALERANTLLNGKVRTRVKTRIQRADTRPTMEDIDMFVASLDELPCDVSTTKDKLTERIQHVKEWCVKAEQLYKKAEGEEELDILDDLQKLHEVGEDFDINLPALDRLDKCIRLCEWRRLAWKILKWKPTEGMERADDFLCRGRWKTDTVLGLIEEGKRVCGRSADCSDSMVKRLHQKLKTATTHSNQCDVWISGGCKGGETALSELWEKVKESDWIAANGIALIRDEIVTYAEMKDRLEIQKEISLRDTDELIQECQKSAVLRSSSAFEKLIETRNKLLAFTKRMAALMHKPHSYYSLFEMLCGRDDLTPLAEGHAFPLYLHTEREHVDEWEELDSFETTSDLSSHCAQLCDKQWELMQVLRLVNERRPLREGCVCAQDKERDTPIITCVLCSGRYHACCVEWDPFMGRLPPGTYLCVRCLRSRRPSVDDVQMAVNNAPQDTFEVRLVMDTLERNRDNTRAVLDVLPDVALAGDTLDEALKTRLDKLLTSFLASELVQCDMLPKLNSILQKIHGELLEKQTDVWEELRSKKASSQPVAVLFVHQQKKKKAIRKAERRAAVVTVTGKRKKNKAVYHEDEDSCSAEKCIKPTSDQLLWIQCEAGCSRWYHYVCVGLTKMKAAELGAYACYRCQSRSIL